MFISLGPESSEFLDLVDLLHWSKCGPKADLARGKTWIELMAMLGFIRSSSEVGRACNAKPRVALDSLSMLGFSGPATGIIWALRPRKRKIEFSCATMLTLLSLRFWMFWAPGAERPRNPRSQHARFWGILVKFAEQTEMVIKTIFSRMSTETEVELDESHRPV